MTPPVRSQTSRGARPLSYALQIAGIYVLVSCLWILVSDRLLGRLGLDTPGFGWVATAKGWAFVAVTGVMLAALIYHRTRAVESAGTNLRAIFRACPLPIIALDPAGRVIAWNPAAERTFGWSEAQVLGKPDPTVPPQGAGDSRSRIRAGESFSALSVQQQRKDGSLIDVDLSMATLRDTGGELLGVVVICEDVTLRNRAAHLERQRAQAADTLRAMDEALGVIGHELRTPLASLRLMSEQLMNSPACGAGEAAEFARAIHAETQRMTEMANNMLEASRIAGVKPRWSFRRFAVTDAVAEASEILMPLSDPARVRLTFDVKPPALEMVGDPDGIRRLLINLISNALKHTPRGSIHARFTAAHDAGHRWIDLTVEDTGAGIPAEVLHRLGERYTTSAGASLITPLQVQGVGLGLVICKGIVAAHGGRIGVVTSHGKGTTVNIRLRADLTSPVLDPGPREITCEVRV